MSKRKFLALLLAGIPVNLIAQSKARRKFYITGLAHTATANDCTIPAIVTYGTDRVDALLHCCDGGGLTVWTEEEYRDMRRSIGKQFDESCKQISPAPTMPAPPRPPPGQQ